MFVLNSIKMSFEMQHHSSKYDMSEEIITVSALAEKWLTEFGLDNETGTLSFTSGAHVSILKDLQFMLNFSVHAIEAFDFFPLPFDPKKNNTVGYHLITGSADITVSPVYYTLPRLQYGNPLTSFAIEKFHAYFRAPNIGYTNIFQKPIPPKLALACGAFLCLIGIICSFLVNDSKQKSKFTKVKIFMDGIEWANSTICQMAIDLKEFGKLKSSVRIMLLSGTLFAVILYSYYSAILLTYMLQDPPPITNFGDLLQLDYTIFAISSVSSSLIAETIGNPNSKLTYIEIDYNDSLRLVFEGDHVHVDTTDLFYQRAKRNGYSDQRMCSTVSKFHIVGRDIKSGFYATKGFKHREVFNSRTLKIMETGLVRRYFIDYYFKTVVQCPDMAKQYQDDLGLDDLFLLFASYSIAILISLLIGLLEWLANFCESKKYCTSILKL